MWWPTYLLACSMQDPALGKGSSSKHLCTAYCSAVAQYDAVFWHHSRAHHDATTPACKCKARNSHRNCLYTGPRFHAQKSIAYFKQCYLQRWHQLHGSCRSPKGSQPEKDEDYWRRLQGGQSQQDEDWSTVDKKKGGKGKAGSKQPDTVSATAASAVPSSWEEDGWEDHANLLDAPRPTPPGLHPRVDAKPSSNDENTQPGQEPATPSGRGNPDVQCEKCGRWGHSEQHCSEQYCDLCSMHGHSTLACPKKSLRAAGRGSGEQEKGRDPQRGQHEPSRPQLCHACGQPGHIAAACPAQKCYNCQQMGHKGYNCPNPSVPRPPGSASRTVPLGNSRRREGDAQSSDRQQGAEQAGEQQRGRHNRGRGREQQADASSSGSATLPMTKPGRSVVPSQPSIGTIASESQKHGMLIGLQNACSAVPRAWSSLLHDAAAFGQCTVLLGRRGCVKFC